jgi:hypothetical protein
MNNLIVGVDGLPLNSEAFLVVELVVDSILILDLLVMTKSLLKFLIFLVVHSRHMLLRNVALIHVVSCLFTSQVHFLLLHFKPAVLREVTHAPTLFFSAILQLIEPVNIFLLLFDFLSELNFNTLLVALERHSKHIYQLVYMLPIPILVLLHSPTLVLLLLRLWLLLLFCFFLRNHFVN